MCETPLRLLNEPNYSYKAPMRNVQIGQKMFNIAESLGAQSWSLKSGQGDYFFKALNENNNSEILELMRAYCFMHNIENECSLSLFFCLDNIDEDKKLILIEQIIKIAHFNPQDTTTARNVRRLLSQSKTIFDVEKNLFGDEKINKLALEHFYSLAWLTKTIYSNYKATDQSIVQILSIMFYHNCITKKFLQAVLEKKKGPNKILETIELIEKKQKEEREEIFEQRMNGNLFENLESALEDIHEGDVEASCILDSQVSKKIQELIEENSIPQEKTLTLLERINNLKQKIVQSGDIRELLKHYSHNNGQHNQHIRSVGGMAFVGEFLEASWHGMRDSSTLMSKDNFLLNIIARETIEFQISKITKHSTVNKDSTISNSDFYPEELKIDEDMIENNKEAFLTFFSLICDAPTTFFDFKFNSEKKVNFIK